MLRGPKRLTSALAGLLLAAVVGVGVAGVVPSGPAGAEPDIDEVQSRVDTLFHEAEQASERLNDARIELVDLRRDLISLEADQERQQVRVDRARSGLQDAIVSQYEGQHLAALGSVAVSGDTDAFVDRVSTMSAYNDMQAQLFDGFSTEAKALDLRSRATAARAGEVEQAQARLVTEKQTIEDKLAQAKDLLARLQAKQRQALLLRGSVALPSGLTTTGRAQAALAYAMGQVGDRYVYGAAGPDAFDCSGLTMMAWAQSGVSLPHSSSAQYGSGPHVAESDLQPGDLVFYYSPISHVGIYIGNGLIAHAANPGAGVRVAELHSMPYVGAVRPG